MNAEEVITRTLDYWRPDDYWLWPTEEIVRSLREACGGGPVVILDDGTLATIDKTIGDWQLGMDGGWTRLARVVPVGES